VKFDFDQPVSLALLALEMGWHLAEEATDEKLVKGVAVFFERERGYLSFSKTDYEADLDLDGWVIGPLESAAAIKCENSRLEFVRALNWMDKKRLFKKDTSSPQIDPSAKIANSAIIESGVAIAAGTEIDAGAIIKADTRIGSNCKIGANTVIGHCGFGYERDEKGVPLEFIHLGGVRIGDNVHIGANCCVDRGSINDTILEDEVKIDNLVQIAHNCQIGSGTMIAAGATLGGSAKVGIKCWISLSACLKNGIIIEDEAFVGMGAVVVSRVRKGITVFGNPARRVN
jgi:acyl-[acyl carrier protein]--UDP-N-acetylglucosamine O-acyltransferase